MRLLDLFCGAGGAAMGYHRAGFDAIVGVDIKPQPRYPFQFVQGDALDFCASFGAGFDVIHASPPCQAYVGLSTKDGRHPRLIEPTRKHLHATSRPFVIENVVGAPLRASAILCGSMFGLRVRRHRLFEASCFLLQPNCRHGAQKRIRAYYGKPGWLAWTRSAAQVQRSGRLELLRGSVADSLEDMGIDWMDWDGLREAIPPAYTEYIGRQLLSSLSGADARITDVAAARAPTMNHRHGDDREKGFSV